MLRSAQLHLHGLLFRTLLLAMSLILLSSDVLILFLVSFPFDAGRLLGSRNSKESDSERKRLGALSSYRYESESIEESTDGGTSVACLFDSGLEDLLVLAMTCL